MDIDIIKMQLFSIRIRIRLGWAVKLVTLGRLTGLDLVAGPAEVNRSDR